MIEINLLPQQLREKKRISFEQVFKTKQILILTGALLLVHLFLSAIGAINNVRMKSLKQSWQNLTTQREQIQQFENERKKLNESIPVMEELINNRVLWSEKLNRISDLLISGIWLSEISIEEQKESQVEVVKCLIIKGCAASRVKDEPALIGRFMQNLKDDISFSADFREIELGGPIKKRLIKQTEVMDFILVCRFRAERKDALLK